MRAWFVAVLTVVVRSSATITVKWESSSCSSRDKFIITYFSDSGASCEAGTIFPRRQRTYTTNPTCSFGADEFANATVTWKCGRSFCWSTDTWGIEQAEVSVGGTSLKLWCVDTNDFGGRVGAVPFTFVLRSTNAPATSAPATIAPPTSAPATIAPPTSVPPTSAPPTNAPPTNAPPTHAPPTNAPLTIAP
ncbi:hypothetical protein DIPPA_52596, partial [Diplonema papillatum]